MKFVCEQCSTHYSIADEKVRQKILRIRCKNCGNVITVRESALAEAGAPAGPAVTSASGAIAATAPRPRPPTGAAPVASSLPAPSRVAPVPAPAASAQSAPRPKLPPPLAKPPARPAAPPRPPEIDEWHLAIDGVQSGPQKLTDLCRKVIAAAAGAEIFLWKDGMDGWKEPSEVPTVAARIRELKVPAAPPAPPPRAPAPPAPPPLRAPRPPGVSRATAGSGLLAVERSAPTPTPIVQTLFPTPAPQAVVAKPAARTEFDDGVPTAVGGNPPSPFDDLGNDGATQISPMDLDSLGAALGKEQTPDRTDEVQGLDDIMVPESMPPATNGHAATNGHNGHNGHKDPSFAADLFAGNHSMPFFPSPSLATKAGPMGGPLTGGPPPAESGLSKLLTVGGIFVRKPYLKVVAGAVAIFVIGGFVALAFVGASAPPGPTPSEVAKAEAQAALDPDEAAENAANRFFPEQQKGAPTRAAVGPAPGRPAPRPGKPMQRPGAASPPPEVAPPPVAAAPEPTVEEPPPSRKLTAPVERRAVAVASAKTPSGPSADQLQGIRNTVSSRMSQDSVKACYDRGLRASGGATGGRIEVQVSIGMSGKVLGVDLKSPDGLKPIHGCVKSAVSRWRFPGGAEPYDTQFTLLMQSGG